MRCKRSRFAGALAASLAVVVIGPSSAGAADKVFNNTIECTEMEGVRFCQGSTATRVKTFDNIPLDVNVTLPGTTGTGPFPLVVQLHGYGGNKGSANDQKFFAQNGYAVLNYSARGFGNSCGSVASRNTPDCAEGWIHLADSRFEVRDTQHLAGLLADEGLVDPQKIAVTGGSYGGGQSTQLAVLRDRIRSVEDGSYKPWVSKGGKPMRIAAAAPVIPWTDLVYSLLPNGRTLDHTITNGSTPATDADPLTGDDLSPPGVKKESFVDLLYAAGNASGFYAPPGADRDADLTTWFARINAGEPYADPLAADIIDEIARHHSGYYMLQDRAPAPTLISDGFTDDLFPVDESVRFVNRTLQQHPDARIAQVHFDYGHMRGQNKAPDTAFLRSEILRWFNHYVKGEGAQPPNGTKVLTQTCPKAAPSEGPFTGATWGGLHPGEVRLNEPAPKVVTSEIDTVDKRTLDPAVAGNPCNRTGAADQPQPGVATYRLPAVTGNGYTLAGSPTVIADLAVTGAVAESAQVDTRLWDVAPDGMQTLVARGVYRPKGSGRQVFQLHPAAYRFAPGHVAKLEVLGQDTPYARKSTGPGAAFSAAVSNLELRLPTVEPRDCSAGAQVLAPSDPFAPMGAVLATDALVPSAAPCPPGSGVPPLPGAASPSCADVSVVVEQDGSAEVPLRCSDPDAGTNLTYEIVAPPANGTATVNGTNATYKPNAGFSGEDSLRYRASDGSNSSNEATVRITVPPRATGFSSQFLPPDRPGPAQKPVRCLPPSSKVRARGIGPIRIGDTRATVRRRTGREAGGSGARIFYCVRGPEGGVVIATLGPKVRLVVSTAPGHRSRGLGRGVSVKRMRRVHRSARSLGRGVFVVRRKGLVFGTRRGQIAYVGITTRRIAGSARLLRSELRRAGVRR